VSTTFFATPLAVTDGTVAVVHFDYGHCIAVAYVETARSTAVSNKLPGFWRLKERKA